LKYSELILRAVRQAWLPMAGSVLTWLIVAAAVGHANAVRLLTALVLVRSARMYTQTDSHVLFRQWVGAEKTVYRKTRRRVVRIELASIAVALAIMVLITGYLHAIGQDRMAMLTAIVAPGLPARHLAALRGRRALTGFRLALAFLGPLLVGIVLLVHPDLRLFAVAILLREWLALAIVLLLPGMRPPLAAPPREEPLSLLEVAAMTAARSRNRFAYRVGRTILGFVPFGGIVARTARSVGAHRRLAPWTGRSVWPIIAVALGTLAGAVIVPIALAKPATLIGAASLLRISASAGNTLLFWRFSGEADLGDDDDDDDD
jgi:hypothetical protein